MIAYAKTATEVIGVLTSDILQPIEMILFALAFIIFFFGVVEFMVNASNEEKRTIGRRHMLWGLLGLAIMVAVNGIIWVLINFVSQIR